MSDGNKKKRYKKNKGNAAQNATEDQTPSINDQLKAKQYADAKEFLNLDLESMSSANQLKLKFYTDILESALECKNNSEKLFNLFLEANKKEINFHSDLIKYQQEKNELDQALTKARETQEINMKKLEDKDKFQKLIIAKANKLQEDKQKVHDEEQEKQRQVIEEAEAYVKDLAQKQQDEQKERERLIELNTSYRNEIQKCLMEGMGLKDEFEKQLKESEKRMKMFDVNKLGKIGGLAGLGGGNTSGSTEEDGTEEGGIFELTRLRTELTANNDKLKEMEGLKKMVSDQEKKVLDDMNKKKEESIFLATENDEIRTRLSMGIQNKEKIIELNKELEKRKNKLQMMNNLNKKFNDQYKQLLNEVYPKKAMPSHDHCCCGHEHHKEEIPHEEEECNCGHEHHHEEEEECNCGHEHHHHEEINNTHSHQHINNPLTIGTGAESIEIKPKDKKEELSVGNNCSCCISHQGFELGGHSELKIEGQSGETKKEGE
ncbi:MAG: hypothetical protein MJ252_07195 [archaeon]|nr:hypothetical protein [archaeon]